MIRDGAFDEKKDEILDEKKMELLSVEKKGKKLTILLSSSSYARQGNTAVRIPDVCGSIAGPARFTNSLTRYFFRYLS